MPPDILLALDANSRAVEARRQLMSGHVNFESADDVRAFVFDMTGSERIAEETVLAWRTARADRGEQVT